MTAGNPDESKVVDLVQVCRAVWHLNRDGKPAKAREHVASIGYCKSTKFMRVHKDEICVSCWTKREKGLSEHE